MIRGFFVLIFSIVASTFASQPLGKHIVACYYRNSAFYRRQDAKFTPDDIDFKLCTHIIYEHAFLNPNNLKINSNDEYLDLTNSFYKRVTQLKESDKQVLLSLGAWDEPPLEKYSTLISDSEATDSFIPHTIRYLKEFNFDGLHLNIPIAECEQDVCTTSLYPWDKSKYSSFIAKLSSAFRSEGFVLSASIPADVKVVDKVYDLDSMSKYLDFAVVTDFGRSSKLTSHIAPLRKHPEVLEANKNLDYSLSHLLEEDFPPQKLVMEIQLFGHSFTLANETNNKLNAYIASSGNPGKYTDKFGFLSYFEICEKIVREGWTVERDPKNILGPYAYSGNQWVSYDDRHSVIEKVQYVKAHDLGGVAINGLDLDDFKGHFCDEDINYPILRAINRELGFLSENKKYLNDKLPRIVENVQRQPDRVRVSSQLKVTESPTVLISKSSFPEVFESHEDLEHHEVISGTGVSEANPLVEDKLKSKQGQETSTIQPPQGLKFQGYHNVPTLDSYPYFFHQNPNPNSGQFFYQTPFVVFYHYG